jgi:glycosyltransferase involved in cell wall biosynthesis
MDTEVVPRLAIIITCWNYEHYVSRAIQSVVSQGRSDCELVVVDDGSTDASWIAIENENVTAYRTENRGSLAACKFGLARTRAPFVLFLDADDELEPESLGKILARLDDDVAKLQFPLIRIDHEGRVISGPVPKLRTFRDKHLVKIVLRTGVYDSPPTSGNVFKRDLCNLLEEVDYENAVDGIMLFAAPFFGDVVSLAEPLGRYRVHGRNDSGLGRLPEPKLLRKEIARFVDRTNHLSRILRRSGQGSNLVLPEQAYFYLERSFYLAISEGRRAGVAHVASLVKKLWSGSSSVKTKLDLTVFFTLTTMLSTKRARSSVAYRLDAGRRTVIGYLRAVTVGHSR